MMLLLQGYILRPLSSNEMLYKPFPLNTVKTPLLPHYPHATMPTQRTRSDSSIRINEIDEFYELEANLVPEKLPEQAHGHDHP